MYNRDSTMITLFGATGFTGELTARALDRAGLPFRIAGRSAAKLAALSDALASHPSTLTADVSRPDSLPRLFDQTRLLINCAGPFTDLGRPIVALAAARGVHYLDITNELAYVFHLRDYDDLARRTGSAIVPACGFEVAISDCVVTMLARDLPTPIDEVVVTYAASAGGMSAGTRLSAVRTLATSWLAYRDGRYVTQAPGSSIRRVEINGHTVYAIAFPSAEIATVPSHLPVRTVTVWLGVSRRAAQFAPAVVPVVSGLMRTPLSWLVSQVLKRVEPPPGAEKRSAGRFAIKVEVRTGEKAQTHTLNGYDPYGLTAEIAVQAAREMTGAAFSKSGVLAPSQVLEPARFLGWVEQAASADLFSDNP